MAEVIEFRRATEDAHAVFDTSRIQWFAAYTYPRHEKRVAEQLQQRAVEAFLPLYDSPRLWNKRRVHVEMPLFPGYIFVRIPQKERLRVLETPSVAYLVSSKGVPVPVPDDQVQQIRECLGRKLCLEPCDYLRPGRKVRVESGPLSGLEGVIQRRNGRTRFIVSVDLIMRSVSVSVEAKDLQLAKESAVLAA